MLLDKLSVVLQLYQKLGQLNSVNLPHLKIVLDRHVVVNRKVWSSTKIHLFIEQPEVILLIE